MSLDVALDEWRALLGATEVHVEPDWIARYTQDTSRFSQIIGGVLTPRSEEEIADVVKIASRNRVPIYPISTGRNWGYGTANPPVPGCVILDLKKLKRIELDEELGLVTLGPGVTQKDLHDVISQRGLPFMVPVTGAGPHCSVLGNALERGFGLTPHADHFGAVTAIEAVLANGERYRPALSELGGDQVDRAFKWGIGPYLDGLFSQGNFGVVTSMTLALARRPEAVAVFFFFVEDDADLEKAVVQVRAILRSCAGNIGSVNLMNAARVKAMASTSGGDARAAAALVGAQQLAAWTGAGAIYGTKGVVAAVKLEVRRALRGCSARVTFINPARIQQLANLLRQFPAGLFGGTRRRLARLLPSLKVLIGEPSEVALPLAYLRAFRAPSSKDFDPARDGCGVYWYSPLVPMKPERVRQYVRLVSEVLAKNGMSCPITLTSLSDRCFDSTVPILFDARNPEEAARSETSYRELYDAGRQAGFIPYRMGTEHMGLLVRRQSVFWRFAADLKAAVDPEGILAPGRYSLLREAPDAAEE